MGKIFCILGKSGSGKDTIFKSIMSSKTLALKGVVTYTTRPMREGEKDGIEYRFITQTELNRFQDEGKIIELRQYQTVRGLWSYCTVDDGQIDLRSGNYLMIVTPAAFDSLIRYFGKESVIPFYIHVEDGQRLMRALKREMKSGSPDYNEMCRRFLADSEDFSDERLSNYGIKNVYENRSLDICVSQIKQEILQIMK